MALFRATVALVLVVTILMFFPDVTLSSHNMKHIQTAQAPTRRLLQSTEFCQSPPPCPVPAIRNVTCKVGDVISCECYYVGRCFPDAHGCYMLSATEKTFCGF